MYGCCTICLLSLLLLVSCVDGKALDGKSNEHIPITSSILPLESCSSTSEIVRYRTSFMNEGHGCADEEFYLCGLDSTERYVIEVCHPDLECDPGTTHQFIVTNPLDKTVELKCLPCPDGWFEPEFSRSVRSSRLLGCTYKHKPSSNISENLVLFENGTKSRATRWYCDIENGFYEQDGNMFCDDVPTKPCECVKKVCPEGQLLRPGGKCIRCKTKIDPNNQFRCDHQSRNNLSITSNDVSEGRKDFPKSTKDDAYPPNVSKDSQIIQNRLSSVDNDGHSAKANTSLEQGNENGAMIPVIVVVLIVVLLVLIIVGLLCYFRCHGWSEKQYKRVRQFFISKANRCNTVGRAVSDENKVETRTSAKEDESTADKDNLNSKNHTDFQITNSPDCQIGDRHTSIDKSQTTVNSTTAHNGDIINGDVYKNCVVNKCSHSEYAIPPPQYEDISRSSQDEETLDQRMHTLKSYNGVRNAEDHSREMDHLKSLNEEDTNEDDEETIDGPLLTNTETESQTVPKQFYEL